MDGMVIALSAGWLASFALGGLLAAKCIQLGLRWRLETKAEKPPTMKGPAQSAAAAAVAGKKNGKRQAESVSRMYDEWINGAQNSGDGKG